MEEKSVESIGKIKNDLDRKNSLNRWLLIIIAALFTGAAWRMRGDAGYGGMSGMFIVGTFLNLLIFYIWSQKGKTSAALIGTLVLLIAVTANGWGTLNGQITGILSASFTRPGFAGYDIEVSPISGAFFMFCVGFGWSPLWAFLISYYFSNKNYNLKQILIGIIIYVSGLYLSEVLLSHLFIPFLAPEAYNLFETSLIEESINLSPWEAYLAYFKNSSWYQSIAGGRNYAAMVSNLSSCIGIIFLWIFIHIKFKDRKAAKIFIMLNLFFGISILLADLWIFWDRGCLGGDSCVAPDWLHGWGMWEYFTGFFAGGFVLWYLFKIDAQSRLIEENEKEYEPLFEGKLNDLVVFVLTYMLILWYAPLSGLSRRLMYTFGLESQTFETYLPMIIGLIIGIILGILIKNGKIHLPKWSIQKYCYIGLFYFSTVYMVIYFATYRTRIGDYSYTLNLQDGLTLFGTILACIMLFIVNKFNKEPTRSILTTN